MMNRMLHITHSTTEDCKNMGESYGEICVHCNKCGRWEEKETHIRGVEGEYKNTRRVTYNNGAIFVPVCIKCGRYVKADDTIRYSEGRGLANEPNATCSKCGRTNMLFEGFM